MNRIDRDITITAASVFVATIAEIALLRWHSSGQLSESQIALGTLIVAAVTLIGVAFQIAIAREELAAVKKDLRQSNLLFEEAVKTSHLWLYGYFETYTATTGLLHLNIYNTGEKVDILHTVTIGIHKSFVPRVGEWHQLDWEIEADFSAYGDFRFYSRVSQKPVYKHDYTEFMGIGIDFEVSYDALEKPLVLWAVSSIYERNPSERYWYYGLQWSQKGSPDSKLVYTLKHRIEPEPYHQTLHTYDGKTTTLAELMPELKQYLGAQSPPASE